MLLTPSSTCPIIVIALSGCRGLLANPDRLRIQTLAGTDRRVRRPRIAWFVHQGWGEEVFPMHKLNSLPYKGQGLVEYGLILVFIAVVVAFVLGVLGTQVYNM